MVSSLHKKKISFRSFLSLIQQMYTTDREEQYCTIIVSFSLHCHIYLYSHLESHSHTFSCYFVPVYNSNITKMFNTKKNNRIKQNYVHFSWPTGDTVKNSLLLKFLWILYINTEKTRKITTEWSEQINYDNEIVSK